MSIQAMVDGFSAQMQKARAASQMTLGKLIERLAAMPEGASVMNIGEAHSYRGYYSDLAFEMGSGTRPAADLLAECRAAMGQVFHGYKGGEYVMGALTPVWIAEHGCCGLKLMDVQDGGTLALAHDDE